MPNFRNFSSLKSKLNFCAGKSIHYNHLKTENPKFEARNSKQFLNGLNSNDQNKGLRTAHLLILPLAINVFRDQFLTLDHSVFEFVSEFGFRYSNFNALSSRFDQYKELR